MARRINAPSGPRKAVESRGFTAVLVSLALAAIVIVLGMIAFPAGWGQRTDNADLQQDRLAKMAPARSE